MCGHLDKHILVYGALYYLGLLSLFLGAIARQPEVPEARLSVSVEEARKLFYWRVTVVCFHSSPVKGKCTWPLKCAWSAVPNGLTEVYETNYSVRLKSQSESL